MRQELSQKKMDLEVQLRDLTNQHSYAEKEVRRLTEENEHLRQENRTLSITSSSQSTKIVQLTTTVESLERQILDKESLVDQNKTIFE
jgi:regulator of replication initiation timing